MRNKIIFIAAAAALIIAAAVAFYFKSHKPVAPQAQPPITQPVNQQPAQQPQQPAQNEAKIKVAVSSYVPYAIAKEVLGDMADITMIIPPGTEPHSFEPLPKTVIEITQSEFFFYTSDKMEPWAKNMSSGAGIALDGNIPNSKDPHIWMDFNNTGAMAQNMARAVAEKYPQKEIALVKNVAQFQRELNTTTKLYAAMLANCKTRTVYHIGHMAFGNLAQNFGFTFKPLVGATGGHEPTAKDMAGMIKEIKDNKIDYIFTEQVLNPALAQTIQQATGAQTLMLYPVEHITKEDFDKGVTYRQFMMANLQNLAQGMGCAEEN